jgi:GNAT superfamily N-acetyltransferase
MKKSSELILVAPDRDKHHGELIDLVSKVFSTGRGYFAFRDYCLAGYIDGSHYDWQAGRVGFIDGQMVTHFGIWDYRMRVGGASVRCGGVGLVATHADFRKRGLMDATARASMCAMRELGYDMSVLFGIDNYYDRFGFVRAWGEDTYTVAVVDVEQGAAKGPLSRFVYENRPDIDKLCNRYNTRLTGTAVRPTYGRHYLKAYTGYLWPRRGSAEGFVIVKRDGTTLEVADHAGEPSAVLAALGRLAGKMSCSELRFIHLHRRSPLCKLIRMGNCRCQTQLRKCGRAMVAVVNLSGTLSKLAGEFSMRLKASRLADWRGQLLIDGRDQQAVLDIDRVRVNVMPSANIASRQCKNAIRGGNEIAQLLIGADEPEAIFESSGTKVSGAARELAGIILPAQDPMLGRWDGF